MLTKASIQGMHLHPVFTLQCLSSCWHTYWESCLIRTKSCSSWSTCTCTDTSLLLATSAPALGITHTTRTTGYTSMAARHTGFGSGIDRWIPSVHQSIHPFLRAAMMRRRSASFLEFLHPSCWLDLRSSSLGQSVIPASAD